MKQLNAWNTALAVFQKEWTDALRDRRTLLIVLGSALFIGPLLMTAMSLLSASFEEDFRVRELKVVAAEQAPSLVEFLKRREVAIKPVQAGADPRAGGKALTDPILVVPAGFEQALAGGQPATLKLLTDGGSPRVERLAEETARVLADFNRERSEKLLGARGLPVQVLDPVRVERDDVAGERARRSPLGALVPFFLIMAVLYGGLNAALDTTAGERERGSLEPLLMNPSRHISIVLGKWAAVAALSALVAVLGCLSFLPVQWVLASQGVTALFPFGWKEFAVFLMALLPLAAALSAVLMAVAIGSKSFKEAQASSTVLILMVSAVPLASSFGGEPSGIQQWVPGLAQNTMMLRALRGEAIGAEHVLLPLAACVALTAACIHYVAGRLQQAAVR
jgi:sodium transport system permease protein